MSADERKKRIEEYLQKAEFASLEELSAHVGVSVSTVRRDLTALEAAGNVKRTHGGARIVNPPTDEFAFSARDTQQLEEKEAIGRAAAALIQPNQSIIVDAGTTAYHVARHLVDKAQMMVTNSLPVANLFASAAKVEVVVSGGIIYPRLGVLVGPLAVETFTKMHADVAIMGAGGLTMEGVTNSHALLIEIQRAMIRAVQHVILCVDHTKLGRRSIMPLCDLGAVGTVVTDSRAPAELVAALRARGVRVEVADPIETPTGKPPDRDPREPRQSFPATRPV